MDTKKDFWDSQAAKGSLSGTQDRYAKELEMQAIARHVRDGMRVLDVGCGDGETLIKLGSRFKITGLGLDYSFQMIDKARSNVSHADIYTLDFLVHDIKKLPQTLGPFDLIYTQRALINLESWEEQRTAILDILKLLRAGGTYVMVECFTEGLDEINALRVSLGLEAIVPPWHNRYLKESEVRQTLWDALPLEVEKKYFSGAYYLMSRVVNAWFAKNWWHEEPTYDHPLNQFGTLLPPECVNLRGQVQLWAIKKKEGE